MFCRQCGKELKDGTRFCPSCGTVIENASTSMQDAKKGILKGMIVCIVIMLLVVCVVLGYMLLNKKVEFQDPLVERCVRLTLGKEAQEPITERECAGIEELLIDCDLDMGIFGQPMYDQISVPMNYVDLCDLKYMTGLHTLMIDNDLKRDILVNLDVITQCEELENLSVRYNPGYTNYYGQFPMGYKYLGEMIGQLPKLEYIDLGYQVAKEHQKFLTDHKEEITIEDKWDTAVFGQMIQAHTTTGNADMEEYLDYWQYQYDEYTGVEDNITYRLSAENEEGLKDYIEELPADMEDIYIECLAGTIDMKLFSKFEELKTLTVVSRKNPWEREEESILKVKNLNSLVEIESLFSLNFYGLEFDEEELSELVQLRELSIDSCEFGEPVFLDSMSKLRELSIIGNKNKAVAEYFEEEGESLESLKFLRVNCTVPLSYEGISRFPNLETLLCISNSAPTTFEYISQCENLEYLFFDTNNETYADELDISELANLKNLEVLYIATMMRPDELVGVEEVLALSNLRSVVLPETSFDSDSEKGWEKRCKEINEQIKWAVKNPSLSCFLSGTGFLGVRDFSLYSMYGSVINWEDLYQADIFTTMADGMMFILPDNWSSWEEADEELKDNMQQ